jgi:P-type conjugative transfer protein TrbJ
MTARYFRALCLASALTLSPALVPAPSLAQWVVFDPSNYAQNLLTAARSLEQINNQITMLQNQARMLLNQARNLESLPFSSLQQIEQSIQKTQQLLRDAQRIAYDINSINTAFQRIYPQGYLGSTSSRQLILGAQERWENALAGHQDALRTQAGVVGNLDTTRSSIDALVSSSQGATGALQAMQAGNQLVALQTKQLADLTALLAAQGRAASLDGARTAANQDQAREQLSRFLAGSGHTYQSQPVQMFH